MPMQKGEPLIVNCRWCGKVFATGGRGRPKRGQLFCSKKCAAFARVREVNVNQLSDVDAAYLAGLVDGEGSIVAAMERAARTTWRLTISNTDRPLLQWVRDVTGVGTIVSHVHDNPLHKDSHAWQCYSWNARDILLQLLPYMKLPEKQRRAKLVIEELSRIEQLNAQE